MKSALMLTVVLLAAFCFLAPQIPPEKDAPAETPVEKPPALQEKPAKAVGGLLGEAKVLNAPIYPGDDVEVEVRLTNAQKEGELQIIDYPMIWVAFHPVVIGPDGQQIIWPEPKMPIKMPEAPMATLAPGAFYGRKIILGAAQLKKPGKYTLTYRYGNGSDLKDKGFNCWTGNVETNTVVFEVADVDAPADANGMKMFIKMKPRYQENKPVAITVYLYNSGDNEKEVRPLSEHLLWLSNGELKDEKGVVPQSNNPDFVDTPRANVKLASHRAITSEYDLRTAYHKLPVGKYAYQLHSTAPGMVSNEVSFEILAAKKVVEWPEKPAPPQEKPAKPVNGLLAEVKVLNAPIYPGDDIETIFRLTNVQKEGDIQIIDFPILGITVVPMCVGPDGRQIAWPMPMMMPRPPDAPTATIKPGASYERKIILSAADLKKPGKYSLSFRYSNSDTLEDKGFKCWTGNIETNTVVFEVADEKPKDGAEPKP